MIDVIITKNKHFYDSVLISGHSNFSEYGSDIVCAAASSLGITLINYLLDKDLEDKIEYYIFDREESNSLLSVKIIDQLIYEDIEVQAGFHFFRLGVESIEESYGDNLMVKIQEV